MEQLNFIAIAASNLDEFFMIRVAGVKHLVESGVKHIDIAGMTPQEQFEAIQSMVHKLVGDQYRYYGDISRSCKLTACTSSASMPLTMTSGCGWKLL